MNKQTKQKKYIWIIGRPKYLQRTCKYMHYLLLLVIFDTHYQKITFDSQTKYI